MLDALIWLVPALPILAAFAIGLGLLSGVIQGEPEEPWTARLALWASGFSLALMLLFALQSLLLGVPGQLVLTPWLTSGGVRLYFSFSLDTLGLSLGLLVSLLAWLTLRFAVNYMHREPGFHRFFLLLSLFDGAMLLIVLAGNAALAFVGWELAGVCSYLLIGYAMDRPTATLNATRAFVTNRIGDAGFLVAIFLGLAWLGGIEWPTFAFGAPQLDTLNAGLLALAFFLAAAAKSGALPFSPWIARALEGPTPSSAIFYGSLMVHAGVYLVIRLAPLFQQAPAVMALVALCGLLTALYGWLGGLVQTDVKSALMFSTTAQVGLMFFACGLGWFDIAALHLLAHASWRAYHFFNAPGLMHLTPDPLRPVPAWLTRYPGLYTAVLRRFWLDELAEVLLVRPTRSLAADVDNFDERVVTRIAGLPDPVGHLSSLAEWEARKQAGGDQVEGATGQARGLLGRLLEWFSEILYWFEERLVLKGSGEGLLGVIERLGRLVDLVEYLLGQPRYLLLLIMATLVVIL